MRVHVNDTGHQFRRLAAHYGVPPERCIAILDDIHVAPGVARQRENGSSGGHKPIGEVAGGVASAGDPDADPCEPVTAERHDLGMIPEGIIDLDPCHRITLDDAERPGAGG